MDVFIQETGYTIQELQEYINQSCVRDQFSNTTDANQICEDCLNVLLDESLSLDEVTRLFVIVAMLCYTDATTECREMRLYTLEKTFRCVDTLSPMHIHMATKRMWEGLKRDDLGSVCNLVNICHKIAVASETGRAVAISLMWTILGDATKNPCELYCFRPFADVIKMIANLPMSGSSEELRVSNAQIIYIAVQAVSFLICSVVFNENEDFRKAGYRAYFTYSSKDLSNLKKWAEDLLNSNVLKITAPKSDDYLNLCMLISEYIHFNIIAVVHDKITELSFGI